MHRRKDQSRTHFVLTHHSDNEDMLGEWFKRTGKRSEIFLCTKFGAGREQPDGSYKVDSSSEWAHLACDRSLKRLGVDYIDLYYW
jgi:aryl-alcohol dehydrogenase-like predicted oxidoreductase